MFLNAGCVPRRSGPGSQARPVRGLGRERKLRSSARFARRRVAFLDMLVLPSDMLSELGPQPVSPVIWVASLLSTVPFFVGLVVFLKAIGRQRSCATCKGSGLVATDSAKLERCPRCGGFLPWQHWWRFFTG